MMPRDKIQRGKSGRTAAIDVDQPRDGHFARQQFSRHVGLDGTLRPCLLIATLTAHVVGLELPLAAVRLLVAVRRDAG